MSIATATKGSLPMGRPYADHIVDDTMDRFFKPACPAPAAPSPEAPPGGPPQPKKKKGKK